MRGGTLRTGEFGTARRAMQDAIDTYNRLLREGKIDHTGRPVAPKEQGK